MYLLLAAWLSLEIDSKTYSPSVAYGEDGDDGVGRDGGEERRSESGENGEAADNGSGEEGEGREKGTGGAVDLEIINQDFAQKHKTRIATTR